MDKEELEEIPWSSLIADAEDGVDRRWYFVAGAIGVAIIVFLGYRILAPSDGQPMLVQQPADPIVATTLSAPPHTPEPTLVVAEADLVADSEPVPQAVAMRAEWFVTDFFTTDGSEETTASIREALVPALAHVELPHDAEVLDATTFVEWARSYGVEAVGDGSYAVIVAYRAIASSADGFVRLPVRAVSVVVTDADGEISIGSLPVEVDISG
ncbi:MAG: hypothetical protein ACR2N7_11415 [Acidimicrobiia bacterium]